MRGDIPPCEECGGDENHGFGCRNQPVSDAYWLGYRHGRRVAQYAVLVDYEPLLREELNLVGTSVRKHRAFALGELRGYRETVDGPEGINWARPDRGMQVPA